MARATTTTVQPPASPGSGVVRVRVADLHLDRENPRSPEIKFEDEERAISFLADQYDVDELIRSIARVGWLDFEPLIVEASTNVVLEGNRRLAALKLMLDDKLRAKLNYQLPVEDASKAPTSIAVRMVNSRQEARPYIAFKHITGPYKWDAYAKARFAAEWLKQPSVTLREVAEALGDTHSTIRRMVDGYNVLEQAQKWGFDPKDRTKKNRELDFSHLYTAVARPAVRDFLGLPDEAEQVVAKDPVPKDHEGRLTELMGWLYGQESKGQTAVIKRQNPNLNELVRVLASKTGLEQLRVSGDLGSAFEAAEGPSMLFEKVLKDCATKAEKALVLVKDYDGSPHLSEIALNLARNIKDLRDRMRDRLERDLD